MIARFQTMLAVSYNMLSRVFVSEVFTASSSGDLVRILLRELTSNAATG